MTDDGILPLDVAVISADPLWSVDAMNRVDRDLDGLRVSDYLAPEPAREDATPGRPAVFVVGPDLTPTAVADTAALTGGRPEIAVLFTVWEAGSDDDARVRAATGEEPLVAGDLETLVRRVDERLLALRTATLPAASPAPTTSAGTAATATVPATDPATGGLPAWTPEPAPDRIIVVTGGSGGTGRTTVAANLAATLVERTGQQVALLDAHGPVGDIPLLFGVPASTRHDLDDFVIDASTVVRFVTRDPATGMQVVVPPTGGDGYPRLDARQLLEVLVALEASTDVVVVDAPLDLVVDAGLAPLATAVVLVATTRTLHLKNVLVAADLLGRPDSLRLVVNEPSAGRRPGDQHSIERAVGLAVLAALPHDDELGEPGDDGRPQAVARPRSGFAKGVEAFADALTG